MKHDEIRERIDNTLAILASLQGNEPHALRRAVGLAAETLKALREHWNEADAEMDVLTTPGRSPAAELIKLQGELERTKDRMSKFEQQLISERQARRVEEQLRATDKKRLTELEQQASQYEAMLFKDGAAFSKYMDRAMEADEKKRGRPPQR